MEFRGIQNLVRDSKFNLTMLLYVKRVASARILHQFLLTKVPQQIGSFMYQNLFASDQTLLFISSMSALLSAESCFELFSVVYSKGSRES